MKNTFYLQLAWTGIGKNKKLYLPYIITWIGMIMMYYIITSLSFSPAIGKLRGGDTIQMTLSLGSYVVAFFSVLFLFYSNSFLIRRRKMEFGLYNMLGMGKSNIGRILFCETIITVLISLAAGLGFGFLFSKLGELFLVNMMQGDVTYLWTLEKTSLVRTVVIFPVIYVVIFVVNLFSIHATNPIALLHSENSGEKPPKANFVIGLAGFVLLGFAYYIAVSIEQPVAALMWFFVAVLMVIAATYLIFIAGSVLMCRLLQKNKKYYYKAEHFISVSSMIHRMKRNGAGLASICILATMVLVMLAFTSSLVIGLDDNIKSMYPYDVNITAYYNLPEEFSGDEFSRIDGKVMSLLDDKKTVPSEFVTKRYLSATANLKGGVINCDLDTMDQMSQYTYDETYSLMVISYDDFVNMFGAESSGISRPAATEILAFGSTDELSYKTLVADDGFSYALDVNSNINMSETGTSIFPVLYFVVNDVPEFTARFTKEAPDGTFLNPFFGSYFLGINIESDDDSRVELYEYIRGALLAESEDYAFSGIRIDSPIIERSGSYATYGGLFFLGIMLSIVFLFATILIVYYKQISEGFEDQSRFEIMQKVGMTKEMIRKSINSQMLTVFFLPLLMAALHLAFAFPMIQKVLILFGLVNLNLLIVTSGISFLLFSVFYVIVYKITTNTYYGIAVSGR